MTHKSHRVGACQGSHIYLRKVLLRLSGQYFSNAKRGGIPVFADLRGCLVLGTFSPYVSLKVGSEACIDMPVSGGFYCSPTIGGKIMTTERQALTLGIGLSVLKPDGWSSDKGFAIKLGYEF